MNRAFAIGDIHGCYHSFRKLLLDEIRLQRTDDIYLLGDYVDRGLYCKEVIDFILELQQRGYRIHTLRGNHEQMMMDSDHDPDQLKMWLQNGGQQTLNSFGVDTYTQLPKVYRNFFEATKLIIYKPEAILVHAGLNFRHLNPFQDTKSMLWIREFEVDTTYTLGKTLIHGHTPRNIDFVLNQHGLPAINLDAGCVFSKREGLGHLVAYNIHQQNFLSVSNTEPLNVY